KRATLCLAWGIIAGVAYLGLIGRGVSLIAKATGLIGSGETIDSGLISLSSSTSTGGIPVPSSLHTLAIGALAALPIAIIGTIVLAILLRFRPRVGLFAGLLIAAACLGLVGSLVFFVHVVATVNNGKGAVVAFLTGIVVSVLLRLQQRVRHSYQRNPALITLLVALVAIVYLVLSNGTNITAIVLADIDVWLALVAFGVILFAGIGIARYRRLIPRGK
ncbi:MAG: hypothetical protein ACLQUY_26590, partial [Ktedonobacterales bacterium]